MASPTRAIGERLVERLDETTCGLDEHAVAHGHDGGHADLQQLRGDRLGCLLRQRGLAGFEEDERDTVIAEQRTELARVDGEMPALFELPDIVRMLEAKTAETGDSVIDAMAIEMNDVIRLARATRLIELVAKYR
jgi:hypothetical protein